jgi:hypothetical protein
VSNRSDRPYPGERSPHRVKVKNRSHHAFDRVKNREVIGGRDSNAAFITLQYRELAGQVTINIDKITKYERQGNSYTTVYLDNGTQELVKEAPPRGSVKIPRVWSPETPPPDDHRQRH